MKKRIIKKSFKGFSLVELLIVVAFIASAFAIVYSWAASQYAKADAKKAVLQIQRLKDKIAESAVIVSPKNPNVGLAILEDIVKVENLIANKMVTVQEIKDNKIVSAFKSGEIKTSAKVMNVNPTGASPLVVPTYTLIIEGVPKQSCGYIFTNYQSKEFTQIKVGSSVAKDVGSNFNPLLASAGCNSASGDFVTIEFTQSITEGRTSFGDEETEYTGAPGRFVDVFNPNNRASIAVNGSGVNSCTGGTVSSADGNYCSCPEGSILHGDRCENVGTPGICIPGQGWNMITKTCENLTNIPLQGQAMVKGVYTHGQYIPQNVAGTIPKTDYHGVLSCDGELRVAGSNDFANVQDRINNINVDVENIDVPSDRYSEEGGAICGICLFGEVLNSEGRCTSVKE